jgi:hypothetical protein
MLSINGLRFPKPPQLAAMWSMGLRLSLPGDRPADEHRRPQRDRTLETAFPPLCAAACW